MAPSVRTPLLARPLPHQSPSTHGRIRSAGPVLKRTRSPDPSVDGRAKRAKASASVQPATAPAGTRDERQQEKEERRAQREAQKEEFRVKYRKAFPSWVFHFDADITNETTLARLTRDIEFFGAVCHLCHAYALICSSSERIARR
jgi:regulatory subunit for Cdc7p protein kinase